MGGVQWHGRLPPWGSRLGLPMGRELHPNRSRIASHLQKSQAKPVVNPRIPRDVRSVQIQGSNPPGVLIL